MKPRLQSGNAAARPGPTSVDLSNPEEVESAADRIKSDTGVPDMIVNNAGAGKWLPLVETSLAEARTMIELPYLAAFYVTRLFLPEMIRRGSGNVTCVTSPASYLVWPNACGYIASRHALRGFTEALRQEVRHTGVHVSLVTLGTVASPYWAHNPGSREHLPKAIPGLMPELSTAQAAEVIADAIEHNRARSVRPGLFKFLFFLSR